MEETIILLKERVEMLTQAMSHSLANHNALVGRVEEAKYLLEEALKKVEIPKNDTAV